MQKTFHLLVVDDEPTVRHNLARALRGCGFETEEASDGLIASEMIRTNQFDLLITDVIMPAMDGFTLARLTARESPSTKILLMSGYVPNPSQAELEVLPFLQKPFHLNVFLMAVRDLLQSVTPPTSFPQLAT